MGMLLEGGRTAEDGFPRCLPLRGSLLFDLADEFIDLLLLVLRQEVLPARQRRERDRLRRREAIPLVLLSSAPGATMTLHGEDFGARSTSTTGSWSLAAEPAFPVRIFRRRKEIPSTATNIPIAAS